MKLFDEGFTKAIVIDNGTRYEVTKIPTIVIESEGTMQGDVEITHRIDGFEVTIYLVIDEKGGQFGFGYFLGGETGLFVSVMDEDMDRKATEIVMEIENSI